MIHFDWSITLGQLVHTGVLTTLLCLTFYRVDMRLTKLHDTLTRLLAQALQ